MKSYYIVWIKKVREGKNKNWLQFDAYVDRFDKNKLYRIDFCGTEINSSIPMTDAQNEVFLGLLVTDFGFAPFDFNRVKRKLMDGKEYVIEE